ncbi:MAG TPA: magnesium and cobalt transport protein CorA [Solirubrobacterales bacterium]|jgi:magnesium transporter|nr:magnesium and cobalt transport protein CorA [Solirubrobacterales bacterium]
MIVDCAAYADGKRREGDLSLERAGETASEGGAFVWLGVFEPTEPEFRAIAEEFGLHELAAEDAVRAHQRPKLEEYGETLHIVVKPARYVDPKEVIDVGELSIFVAPGFVITVRHGGSDLTPVRERLEGRRDLLEQGPAAVLYAIVDYVVDRYLEAAHGFDEDVREVELQVFGEAQNPTERIYKLEREVLEFQAAATPLGEALEELCSGSFQVIPQSLHEYFRDVEDHLRRVTTRIESFRQLLDSALEANLTQVSMRQNEDMRKISAWVAIAAVPTMFAGIYGMNFEHMPELEWTFGYPVILAVILAICLYLYWRFKRAGWL